MSEFNEGYATRALDGGELCSDGTQVKTIFQGGITLVPVAEVYEEEPVDRTHTDVVDETVPIPAQAETALLSLVAVGIGTTPQNVATGPFNYRFAGVRATKDAVAAGTAFTATTHDIADPDANPREAIYLLSVDDEGAITITKGDTAAADEAVAPDTPADEIPIAYVKIQHDGSAIFDATTNSLAAAHLTVTYTPVPVVP